MFEALLAIAESLIYWPDLFTDTRAKLGCAAVFVVICIIVYFAIIYST